MQSSFNVIKGANVKSSGEKKIVVEYITKTSPKEEVDFTKSPKDPYERLAASIIDAARSKSDEIVKNSYEKIAKAQMEAEQLGYASGYEKAHEIGYQEGYKKAIEEAKLEAENIKDNAERILKSAKEDYENYLQQKTEDIKKLIGEIVSDVFKKEIDNRDTVTNLIREAIKDSRNTKTFIIKCNSFYEEEFKNCIDLWKQSLGFKGDIFIISDDSLEKGQIIIDRDNGKVEIHIEDSIEKVKDIIMNS